MSKLARNIKPETGRLHSKRFYELRREFTEIDDDESDEATLDCYYNEHPVDARRDGVNPADPSVRLVCVCNTAVDLEHWQVHGQTACEVHK